MSILEKVEKIKQIKFKNLNLGVKYAISLVIAIILFIISTVIVFNLLAGVKKGVNALGIKGERAVAITQMASLFRTKDIRIADYMNSQNEELIEEYKNERDKFEKLQRKLEPEMKSDKLKKLFKKISNNDQIVTRLFLDTIVPAIKMDINQQAIMESRKKTIKIRSENVFLLQKLRKIVNQEMNQAQLKVKNNMFKTEVTLIIAILISSVLGLLIIYLVNRSVKKNLNQVVEVSNQIAKGNLKVDKIECDNQDEIGKLAKAVNKMVRNLRNIITNVDQAAENTVSTTEELSTNSEEAAASIEEIATSTTEFNNSADKLNATSQEMNSSAHEVNTLAKSGLVQMKDT